MYSEYKVISRSIAALVGAFAWSAMTLPVLADGATRDLPAYYEAGTMLVVSITTVAPPDTFLVGVEDSPPAGWTVGLVSDNGQYLPESHKVRWTFGEPWSRTVTYEVTPPEGEEGSKCFEGIASFNGFNEPVEGDECVAPLDTPQACCLADNTCEDRMEADCVVDDGVPQGSGTVCTPSEACCLYNGGCEDVDPLCCDEHGGITQGEGTDCVTHLCPVIPTLSEWGVAAMTLLVLTAGTLVLRRPRRVQP